MREHCEGQIPPTKKPPFGGFNVHTLYGAKAGLKQTYNLLFYMLFYFNKRKYAPFYAPNDFYDFSLHNRQL